MEHIAKPTKQQLDWHEMELGVLIHYCLEMYRPELRLDAKILSDVAAQLLVILDAHDHGLAVHLEPQIVDIRVFFADSRVIVKLIIQLVHNSAGIAGGIKRELRHLPALLHIAVPDDIRFSVRLEHGVEFIAIDNGYHKIEQWQLDRLKEEIAKGYPIILCLHAPLYAPDIYDYTAEVFGKPMWMMSVPDALMDKSDEGDYLAQKEDAVTHEAYELITHTASIKAILAGHMHYDYVFQVTPTLKQYVVNTESCNIVTVR